MTILYANNHKPKTPRLNHENETHKEGSRCC